MNNSICQQQCRDYFRIEKALQYAAENFREQPSLADLAASVHLSEHHFQRIFRRWAGVSPKQFLQYLTLQHARECLSSNMTVLDTAYDSGLAAPSRLYELFVRLESLTPAEYKSAGAGLVVNYGFHVTPFGECLIGTTARGITHLSFVSELTNESGLSVEGVDTQQQQAVELMKDRLPNAMYQRDDAATASCIEQIFTANTEQRPEPLSVLVSGSAFQVKVWEAMLRIEPRKLVSYQQLAHAVDSPNAVRAVGTAVGQNPVGYLIPCHRVIRSNGMLGQYRWGVARKLAVQGWEHRQSLQNEAALRS
jgi:AraC family transcriptional regulator of adaptative response/methylated-DNA-[protein]-cysteine methyltransferase